MKIKWTEVKINTLFSLNKNKTQIYGNRLYRRNNKQI